LQSEARKYGGKLRLHLAGTGGGPPLADPEVSIAAMFEIIHGSTGEGAIGIQSGVETGAGTSAQMGGHGDDDAFEVDDLQPQPDMSAISMIVGPPSYHPTIPPIHSPKHATAEIVAIQRDVLLLQRDLIKSQKALCDRQMEVASLQQQYYAAKLAKLSGETHYLNL
jgi:hypothetical protein